MTEVATFRKRGTSWSAQVYIDGRFRSKSFPTKPMAAAWARDVETQRDKGTLRNPALDKVTVNALHGPWRDARKATAAQATLTRQATHWRLYVEPAWGCVEVASIRKSQVQAWIAELVERNVGAPTIESALRLLSTLLEVAVDDRIIESNPARRVALPKYQPGRRRFITSAELDKVLAQVTDPRDRLLLALMATTGLSIGEVLGLTKADLGAGAESVSVFRVWTRHGWKETPKASSRRRTVPVPVALRPALIAHSRAMLPAASAFSGDDRNLNRRVLAPACKAAEVEVVTLHELRHHAASTWIRAGLPLFEVARALGHSSTRMVERVYGHLAPDAHDRLLAAMATPTLT